MGHTALVIMSSPHYIECHHCTIFYDKHTDMTHTQLTSLSYDGLLRLCARSACILCPQNAVTPVIVLLACTGMSIYLST